MSAKEKKRLIDSLTEVHLSTLATLEKVDMEMPVYKETGWRVRDIVGHISTWDQEIAKSLNAYQAGSEYLTLNLDEEEIEFNESAVIKQGKLSTKQIIKDYKLVFAEFCKAIQEITDDRFPGDLLYPWGNERGEITTLVDYMIEHGIEHRDEIIKASQEL
jgi:hypothetical protein